jgi:tRNA threonylcarbamoyladenosine biosynthesis protein TsaB
LNILAIDCSTDIMAVALGRGYGDAERGPRTAKHPYREERGHATAPGKGLVTLSLDAGFRHAERLMGSIEYCMAEAGVGKDELDLIVCAEGPGSFTGLRIAMATAKGLALGLSRPFVAVSTLDAYAAEWEGCAPVVVPMLDAKRSRFFYAIYEGSALRAGPFDDTLESVIRRVDGYPEVLFVGPDTDMVEGIGADRSGFRLAAARRRSPVASLVELGLERYKKQGPSPSDASPNYLRASDAEEGAAKG